MVAILLALLLTGLSCFGQAFTLQDQAFVGASVPKVAANAYTAYATTFNGSSWLSNNTVYLTQGKQCTVSVWFKLSGGDGTTMHICTWRNDGSVLRRNSDNTISFGVRGNAHNPAWIWSNTNLFTVASGWTHFAASFDSSDTNKRWIYINGAQPIPDAGWGWTTYWVDETLLTSDNPTLAIGSTYGAANKLVGCIAELWLGSQYIDLSANIGKFYSGGKPVDLGSSGQTPTGISPEFYFKNSYATFNVNAGTNAVTMGVGGTLSDCTAP